MPKKRTFEEDQLVARIARALGATEFGRSSAQTAPIRMKKRLQGSDLRLGMGDDTAVFVPSKGYETILTCDWFLEGTHFLRDRHPAEAVGWKCLVRAVSDVAAMGGKPRYFLLGLALPSSHTGRWLDEFLSGLRRAARRFESVAAGGDTTARSEILINVMVVGEVPAGSAVLRSGASPGDLMFVSGTLGEAEMGLWLMRGKGWKGERSNPALKKHLYPKPRLALGQWLAAKGVASAMMDISDGLSSDLPRLCAASGVGARIEAAKLPVVKVPKKVPLTASEALQMGINGGDDYELLFAVPERMATRLPSSIGDVKITQIGIATRERNILLVRKNGRAEALVPHGWDPFRR